MKHEQIANLIASLGFIISLITLFLTLKQNKETKSDVAKLASTVDELKRQNAILEKHNSLKAIEIKNQIRPNLKAFAEIRLIYYINHITIKNTGNHATILNIRMNAKGAKLNNQPMTPLALEKDGELLLILESVDIKDASAQEWELHFTYCDANRNKYVKIFMGSGTYVTEASDDYPEEYNF